jgi:hypothetical protein
MPRHVACAFLMFFLAACLCFAVAIFIASLLCLFSLERKQEAKVRIADCGLRTNTVINLDFTCAVEQAHKTAIRNPQSLWAWHCDCPKDLTLHSHCIWGACRAVGSVDGHDLNVWGLNAE